MAYIMQMRRGWKEINEKGEVTRDDWASYEKEKNYRKPFEGELCLEYVNGVPRLKIGDGIHNFSELPYMSVDSFILPKPVSVTLYADKWKQISIDGEADTYYQVVTVDNAVITQNSKVDLQPSTDQLCDFYDLGIALTTENDGGVVTIYSVGVLPTKTYNIQATVTEIVLEGGE